MAGKSSKGKASKDKASKGGSALTHIDASGEARMVDVSAKEATERTAVAEGRVVMTRTTLDLIVSGNARKGDVLATARIAGIMAAKRTPDLDPAVSPARDRPSVDRRSQSVGRGLRCASPRRVRTSDRDHGRRDGGADGGVGRRV